MKFNLNQEAVLSTRTKQRMRDPAMKREDALKRLELDPKLSPNALIALQKKELGSSMGYSYMAKVVKEFKAAKPGTLTIAPVPTKENGMVTMDAMLRQLIPLARTIHARYHGEIATEQGHLHIVIPLDVRS
jgi:hypothetical protein